MRHPSDVYEVTQQELEIIVDALATAAEEWDYMIGLPDSDGFDREDLSRRADRAVRLLAALNDRRPVR